MTAETTSSTELAVTPEEILLDALERIGDACTALQARKRGDDTVPRLSDWDDPDGTGLSRVVGSLAAQIDSLIAFVIFLGPEDSVEPIVRTYTECSGDTTPWAATWRAHTLFRALRAAHPDIEGNSKLHNVGMLALSLAHMCLWNCDEMPLPDGVFTYPPERMRQARELLDVLLPTPPESAGSGEGPGENSGASNKLPSTNSTEDTAAAVTT